jgi:hypothetical protein
MRLTTDNYAAIVRKWDELQEALDLGLFHSSDMEGAYFDEDDTREFYEFDEVLYAVHKNEGHEDQLDDDVEVLVTAPYSAGHDITKGCATLSVSALRKAMDRGQMSFDF